MSNRMRQYLIIIVVLIQMGFFVGWYLIESNVLGSPIAQIMVKPRPYDPRDLLSGQYLRLNYEFSTLSGEWVKPFRNNFPTTKHYKPVWVILTKQGDLYHPTHISPKPVTHTHENQIVIKGRLKYYRIYYGIEKYFVPEGSEEPNVDDTLVKLNVYDNGAVRIDSLLVNGKPWP